jgi:hypothetical protein
VFEQLVDRCRVRHRPFFAGLGFGSSTASRSIISRPRRTGLCSGSMHLCSGSIRHFKRRVVGGM